jgi:hypothetical protein
MSKSIRITPLGSRWRNAEVFPQHLLTTREANLVDIYHPVKLLDRALHYPRSVLEGHRGFRHDASAPDFGLCETAEVYFLEGEFPGVARRESLTMKWIDSKTLGVEDRIDKANLEKEWCSRVGKPSSTEDTAAAVATTTATTTTTPAVEAANTEREDIPVQKSAGVDDGGMDEGLRTWASERRAGLSDVQFPRRR